VPSAARVEVRDKSPLMKAGRCPKAEFAPRRDQGGVEGSDCVSADAYLSIPAVKKGVRLIQGHHAVHVSRPLPSDQEAFELLRIIRRLAMRLIAQNGSLNDKGFSGPNGLSGATLFPAHCRQRAAQTPKAWHHLRSRGEVARPRRSSEGCCCLTQTDGRAPSGACHS